MYKYTLFLSYHITDSPYYGKTVWIGIWGGNFYLIAENEYKYFEKYFDILTVQFIIYIILCTILKSLRTMFFNNNETT